MSKLNPRAVRARVPEWVWVPARAAAASGDGTPRREIDLHVRDGESAALVFSSRAALVAALGAAQPWTLVDAGRLDDLLAAQGIERFVLDPGPGPSTACGDRRSCTA